MKRRYGRTIKSRLIDQIWKDYVDLCVIRPLLKYGSVEIEKGFELSIVGKKVENSKSYNFRSKGKSLSKGFVRDAKLNKNLTREGKAYKIVCKDDNYKHGKLIFQSDSYLSKKVHENLINTNTYYKIVA